MWAWYIFCITRLSTYSRLIIWYQAVYSPWSETRVVSQSQESIDVFWPWVKVLSNKQNSRVLEFSVVVIITAIHSEGYGNLSCTIFWYPHTAQLYFIQLFKGFCLSYSEPQYLPQITDCSSPRHSGNIIRELSSKNVSLEECLSDVSLSGVLPAAERTGHGCELAIGVAERERVTACCGLRLPLSDRSCNSHLFFRSSNKGRFSS